MEFWDVVSAVVVGACWGLIGVALALLPRTRVSLPVYAFIAAGAFWQIGDVLAETATGMSTKLAGVSLLYTGSIAVPAFWWIIVLRWAEQHRARLPFRSAAWTIVPLASAALMWLVMITNPWHGEFLTPVVGGRNVYQPLWYVMAAQAYALIIGALAVEIAVSWRVPRREARRQAGFLIAASLMTLIPNTIYVLRLVQADQAPVVLSISGALLVFAMAREGLFGVLPWALQGIAADHPDGLVVVGSEGNVSFANARAHELLAPIEVSSRRPFAEALRDERIRADSAALLQAGDEELWETLGRPGGVMFRIDAASPRWLQLNASVVRGARGRTRGQCVRISDRTLQKELELHARQARRLDSVADLARTLSRQFRGAFALVHDNAELLLADPGRPHQERKLARIVEAAKYGSEIAQELQLYTGSVSTMRVVVELSEIVEESCSLVEADLPPGVQLAFVRGEALLPVHVDAIQLRHCIFNVLTNAIESMARMPGDIRITTGVRSMDPARESLVCGSDQPPGEFAFVAVRDEGRGMDSETEERAFEPFFSTRGKDRGSGLPTVLGIARAHDALIALENERGRGCDVTLFFPLEREGAPSPDDR